MTVAWKGPARLMLPMAILLALAAAGCGEKGSKAFPVSEIPPCRADDAFVEELLVSMTLEEKVGQMYYVGVEILPGIDLPGPIRTIQELHVGAVHEKVFETLGVWNRWSVRNTNQLQGYALAAEPPIPLLIGIDQEGGLPQSLATSMGGTDTPGNLGLGATFDPDRTALSYALMADQLRELGIHINLAPVLDVMTSHEEVSMYTRCFGERTVEVSRHAHAAVLGTERRRIAATAKHFPGQTAAPGDEHTEFPICDLDEHTLRETYLPPFQAAIDAGLDIVMPTHARFTAWDPDLPATLSPAILTGLLREEMGFDGLILTDDMNMWALAGNDWGGMPDVMAIDAGADMIMDIFESFEPSDADGAGPYPTDLPGQIDSVAAAVRDGRIPEARIDESVRRILRLKCRLCLFEEPYRDVERIDDLIDTPEQQALAAELHDAAITAVRDDTGLLPLACDGGTRAHVIAPGLYVSQMYPGAWANYATKTLATAVREIDPDASGDAFGVPLRPWRSRILLRKVARIDPDVVVVGTYNALNDEGQRDLVLGLLEAGHPTIVVALAMPYDLLAFPGAPAYLAAYSNHDLAVESVARVLYGLSPPGGRLPVSIPGLYDVGWSAPSP